MASNPVRLIAFYLPQYHPIPENDRWWGKGFTEWTNVTRARPLFWGHYQPHLPADLGFYDLRVPEVRQAQADLAREHGVYGFCYYHYWFKGQRLLERPFQEVLQCGKPNFPFCLCWANENWTREWDGLSDHILMEQEYSPEDDGRHIEWLAQVFSDKRYIRVEGKPLFLVYRPLLLPRARATTDLWRAEARRLGIGELLLGRVESFPDEQTDPRELGFDVAVEFQPDWAQLGWLQRRGAFWRLAAAVGLASKAYQANYVFDYAGIVHAMQKRESPAYPRCPCVMPSWDNTARALTRPATIIKGATPELYERWLTNVVARARQSNLPRLVFINAWNEWGEGNHLEPDQQFGRGYLEATQRALRNGT